MLVKREAPGFSVTIHVRNILLYCLIIQSQPYTIIIVDLWETSNKNEPCPPVTATRPAKTNRLQTRQDNGSMRIKLCTVVVGEIRKGREESLEKLKATKEC